MLDKWAYWLHMHACKAVMNTNDLINTENYASYQGANKRAYTRVDAETKQSNAPTLADLSAVARLDCFLAVLH